MDSTARRFGGAGKTNRPEIVYKHFRYFMKSIKPVLACVIIRAITFCGSAFCQSGGYKAIYSGIPWFNNNGNTISAHGATIIKDNDRYYLFGERHNDTSNAFAGI